MRDPFVLPGPTGMTDPATACGAGSGHCQPLENQLHVYFNIRKIKTMKFSLPPTKNFLCSQEMIPNMTENIQQAVQYKVNQNL